MLEVIQADRDAAAALLFGTLKAENIRAGLLDNSTYVQAFAAHRIAALSGVGEIVEALETFVAMDGRNNLSAMKDIARKALARFREQQS